MTVEPPHSAEGGWRGLIRAHPVLAGGAAALAIGAVAFVLIWFQPQALLFDTVVEDDFPQTEVADDTDVPDRSEGLEMDDEPDESDDGADRDPSPGGDDDAETVEPTGPVALATGQFASRNRYTVTGSATVYELEDGTRILRLEDFESTNGPDLYVYLTAADHADSDEDLDDDVVDLGRLRGNVGSQNYEIPAEVDLEHHDTVVIWCLRFTASFGAADLTAG